jgi:hypothetical protein
MNTARLSQRLVLPATLAVVAAACSGSDAGTGDGETSAISINSCDPDAPLIPASTSGPCVGNPLDQMFTGLVRYIPTTAEPEDAVASDISSNDTTSRGASPSTTVGRSTTGPMSRRRVSCAPGLERPPSERPAGQLLLRTDQGLRRRPGRGRQRLREDHCGRCVGHRDVRPDRRQRYRVHR